MFSFLLRYYNQYRLKIVSLFVISLILSLAMSLVPLFIGNLVDSFMSKKFASEIYIYILVLSLLFIFLNVIQPLLSIDIVNGINYHVRTDLIQNLKHKQVEDLTNNQSKIVQTIINDIPHCQSILITTLFNLIIHSFTFIWVVFILFSMNTKLSLIILSSIPLYIFIYLVFGNKLKMVSEQYLNARDYTSMNIQNILSNIKILKHNLNKEDTFFTHYDRGLKDISFWYYKHGIINTIIKFLYIFLQISIIIIVIFMGWQLIGSGEISLGVYISFILYIFNFFSPIQQLISLLMGYKTSLVSIQRVYNLFHLPNERDEGSRSTTEFKHSPIVIESFSRPYLSSKRTESRSFVMNSGVLNFLVGENGAGKTTLFNAINRYISIENLVITIGGRDINTFPLETLRDNIKGLYQEVQVVNNELSVFFTKYEEVKLELASPLREFIENHSDKFENKRSFEKLSGGQKQLFCFINVLLDKPKVLLIDEGFSNMDINIIKDCITLLNQLKHEMVIVIVSHDTSLQTICDTSNVLYFD
ncbi:ABC transporter ATP-binding protein [Metasolibacillus meyeri]|uniref:ABC transporter ATP-binding protein n=1 Tax=Metasolibacillus meyeri TaxID=1071052 RepID=UPI000D30DB87|nr:ABC transporter ATP-binding protein [Metasolibacillus meyeri]